MKITVTGAAGKIGSVVCRVLVDAGHDVVATDMTYRKDLPVPIRVADLLDRTGCYALVEGSDALVHLGNHPNPHARPVAQLFAENCQMTANVFQAAHEVGVPKWIYASSIQAIRGNRQKGVKDGPSVIAYLPADGCMPSNPGNLYGASKVAGEHLLKHYVDHCGHDGIAIRFPWVMNPGASQWEKLPANHPNPYLDELFSFLTVQDAAGLVAAIVGSPIRGYRCYFPASPQNLPQRPVAELIREHYPTVALKRPIGEIHSLIDTSEIERETGWRPTM